MKKQQLQSQICKQEYLDALEKVLLDGKSDWLYPYEQKEVYGATKLSNGTFYTVSKSNIKTRFCFGYGQNGVSTDEDHQHAKNRMHNLEKDFQVFIEKNIEGKKSRIEQLKDKWNKIVSNTRCSRQHMVTDIIIVDSWAEQQMGSPDPKNILPQEDRNKIISLEEEQLAHFIKRLHTYLKRYGTSKLTTWTYLSD